MLILWSQIQIIKSVLIIFVGPKLATIRDMHGINFDLKSFCKGRTSLWIFEHQISKSGRWRDLHFLSIARFLTETIKELLHVKVKKFIISSIKKSYKIIFCQFLNHSDFVHSQVLSCLWYPVIKSQKYYTEKIINWMVRQIEITTQ